MIIKESTETWPTGAKKIVLRNIPFAYDTVIFKETSNGGNTFAHSIHSKYQLVISYYYPKKVFVVWNAAVHHHIHDSRGMTTLSIGSEADELLKNGFESDRIDCCFKTIKQRGTTDCVELVVIVGVDALYDFCKAYQEYILPQVNTIPKGKKCLYATPEEKLQRLSCVAEESYQLVEREREKITRAKRNPLFRDKVIDRWGEQCIVCGAKERKILEAAHIYSVKQGGSDDPANGYCLCANHHRMYDTGILNIHLDKKIFDCESEECKKMSWYKDAEIRGFTLFLPNE